MQRFRSLKTLQKFSSVHAQGNPTLYTAGDLAATMAANPYLLALSANGYFNSVTPFYQTKLTLDAMPLQNPAARANLAICNYPSGHMVYLDGRRKRRRRNPWRTRAASRRPHQ